jgi:hypothetical protein
MMRRNRGLAAAWTAAPRGVSIGNRAAVLSQAGAPLSWTSERSEGGRQGLTSASLSERSEQSYEGASRHAFRLRVTTSRRIPRAIRERPKK